MSRLRHQLSGAKRGYHDCRYHGSLAADIGLSGRGTLPHASRPVRWRWLIAAAAAAAVAILLLHNNETIQTVPVPTPKVAVTTTPSQPVAAASPDDTTAVELSAPSLSFESITDWPSVSADVPSLGSFTWPGLNTQESQTPTTQESSS